MNGRRLLLSTLLASTTLAGLPASALAQAADFPSKRVTFVVPFTPGGAGDLAARALAAKLGPLWGQPVVVENRAGAGGNTGSQHVALAEPDGHTILIGSTSSHGINPSIYAKMPYDPVTDFTHITMVGSSPHILIANPSVQANTRPELLAYARANPGKLNFSSGGNGTSTHLAGELLATLADIKLVHIPYRGAAEGVHGVAAGDTQLMFENLSGSLPQIRAGRLKGLAITTPKRLASMPDLPTASETIPGFESSVWFGIFAPKGVPAAVADKLNRDITAVMAMPDIQERMDTLGLILNPTSRDAQQRYVASEVRKWADVVKNSGATIN